MKKRDLKKASQRARISAGNGNKSNGDGTPPSLKIDQDGIKKRVYDAEAGQTVYVEQHEKSWAIDYVNTEVPEKRIRIRAI